jgi:hypothetical protein
MTKTKTSKAWDRFFQLNDESAALLDAIVRLTFAICDATDPVVARALGRELVRVRESLDTARKARDAAFAAATASSVR